MGRKNSWWDGSRSGTALRKKRHSVRWMTGAESRATRKSTQPTATSTEKQASLESERFGPAWELDKPLPRRRGGRQFKKPLLAGARRRLRFALLVLLRREGRLRQ